MTCSRAAKDYLKDLKCHIVSLFHKVAKGGAWEEPDLVETVNKQFFAPMLGYLGKKIRKKGSQNYKNYK